MILGALCSIPAATNGWSRLHRTVRDGYAWEISALLDNDVVVDARAPDGTTPFALAVLHYANALTRERQTGSSYAFWPHESKNVTADLVEFLLRAGADAGQRIVFDQGCLASSMHVMHFACFVGDVEMVALLLRFGVSANVKCDYESPSEGETGVLANFDFPADTPLTLATKRGQLDLMTLLLDHGADVSAFPENSPMSALHVACNRGMFDAAQLLLDAGAPVDLQAADGPTPLYLACDSGNDRLVAMLLRRGAKANKARGAGKWIQRLNDF